MLPPMRRISRAAALPLLATLVGCALVPRAGELDDARQVVVGEAVFVLQYAPVDEKTAQDVARALEVAAPRIARWGRFEAPMFIRIHPTHEALEAAVRRFDYPWLRAWARYDTIDLQSPRTWGLLGAGQEQVVELLTHELTHCLMYQRAGTASNWMRKGIPLWFREGMASVTAAQGYRRPTDEEIWRWLRSFPEKDPIADGDALYQAEAGIVYGSAHRAFEFLVARYGDAVVLDLLDRMKGGLRFSDAFERAVGFDEAAFAREYVRYVKWEGWRGPTKPRPQPLLAPARPEGGAGGR